MKISIFLVSLLSLCCLSTTSSWSQSFTHPGVPFTKFDLEELKKNIKKEPWKSGYENLINDSHASLNYKMKGPFQTVSRSPHINRNEWLSDIQAVHDLTFAWVFTGDPAYAKKATDILDAWAVTNTKWIGDEAILDIGDHAQFYATAADILKSMYTGWTPANTEHVNNYFANVLWPTLDVPSPVRGANQGADALKAALGIAAFLDDPVKFKQAIYSLRNDPSGGLMNTLSNGQVGDSGRDEGHTAGQIWNYAWAAEVAWKQGVDVYADLNNRIHAASELYAKYNLDTAGIKFIPFGNPYGYYTKFGWDGGVRRKNPFYNILTAAYSLRKGMPMPYTDQLRELTGDTKLTFLFKKIADPSKAKMWPAEFAFNVLPVTFLETARVGSAKMDQFSQKGQKWLMEGTGTISVPSAAVDTFVYAFKKVTGDAAIIVRVDELSATSAKASAGLMIRESLAPDSKNVGIYLNPGGWVRTSWRGALAFCKTDISWDIKTQTPKNYEEHNGLQAPYWLKLERRKNRVSVYHSRDSQNWTCLENVEIPMQDAVYLGISTSSGNSKTSAKTVFAELGMATGKNAKVSQ